MCSIISDDFPLNIFRKKDHELINWITDQPETTKILYLRFREIFAKRWLSIRITTYLIEYLGEFEFIFETILDYESVDQMGPFEAKKKKSKISCLGTFT